MKHNDLIALIAAGAAVYLVAEIVLHANADRCECCGCGEDETLGMPIVGLRQSRNVRDRRGNWWNGSINCQLYPYACWSVQNQY